jgi:hypothetical protein
MTDRTHSQCENSVNTQGAVRRILLEQYTLYEAKHHSEVAGESGASRSVVPKVHTFADVYKCLHQGEFGIGHSIHDPALFGQMLQREFHAAEASSDEPLLEDVSTDRSVLRLNLRPYRRRFVGYDNRASALLLQVCLASATVPKGSARHFLEILNVFSDLNRGGEISVGCTTYVFPDEELMLFVREVADFVGRRGHVPVLSHSQVYRRYNSPSYRVVNRAVLEDSPLASILDGTT